MPAFNEHSRLAAEVCDAYGVHYARETGDTEKAEKIGILGDRLNGNANEKFGGDLVVIERDLLDRLFSQVAKGCGQYVRDGRMCGDEDTYNPECGQVIADAKAAGLGKVSR